MFLKRVQVPDFRALKNVDILFEKELTPHVFPLGSQNGGGKSTLLQLLFILLHASVQPNAQTLIENLFEGFAIPSNSDKRDVAFIEILNENQELIRLNFLIVSNDFIVEKFAQYKKSINNEEFSEEEEIQLHAELEYLEDKISSTFIIVNQIDILRRQIQSMITRKANFEEKRYHLNDLQRKALELLPSQIKQKEDELEASIQFEEKIKNILSRFQIAYLSKCDHLDKLSNEGGFLVCEIDYLTEKIEDLGSIISVLENISPHVFLAAPSTQVFLFMPSQSRKKLLIDSKSNNDTQYMDDLQKIKYDIQNFFTYEFLPVDYLVDLFKEARDEDYASVVKTGDYGMNYHNLLQRMNSILGGKKINSREDLSGIQFFLDDKNGSIEIYPEDLSHGELKRFGVYMWLISSKLSESIVLMDELEIALHPDWQYQIVHDLIDWGPTNQYILATHSYSLCEAVTPAHVKEIPPHLLSSSSIN